MTAPSPSAETLLPWPAHTEIEVGEGFLRALLRVPSAHPVFEGHFPGNPILPGVVSLGWILEGLRALAAGADATAAPARVEIVSLKFPLPVFPGEPLVLELTAVAGPAFNAVIRGTDGQARVEGKLKLTGGLDG